MVKLLKSPGKGKMHCPNCSKIIASGYRLCPKCGHNLRSNGVMTSPQIDLQPTELRRGLPMAPPATPERESAIQGCEGDIQAAVEFAKRMYGIGRAVQLLMALDAAVKELA